MTLSPVQLDEIRKRARRDRERLRKGVYPLAMEPVVTGLTEDVLSLLDMVEAQQEELRDAQYVLSRHGDFIAVERYDKEQAEAELVRLRGAATLTAGLTGGMLAQLDGEDTESWGGWVRERVLVIHRAITEPLGEADQAALVSTPESGPAG